MQSGDNVLSESEKDVLRQELLKTEDEVVTLRQVLAARQKHVDDLRQKLGEGGTFAEIQQDINRGLRAVTETGAYQKTAEATAAATDTVKGTWNDLRNSNIFKSFESSIESAYTQAKMAASTSIDQLAGAAKTPSTAGTPVAEEVKPK